MASSNCPHHVLDVQVTSPSPPNGGLLTLEQARVPLRAAKKAAEQKRAKYRTIAPINNLGFIPIIFETTGSMHEDVLKLLAENLKAFSMQSGISFDTLWRYWISSLMVTLQSGNADAIMKRSSKVNGSYVENHETSPLTIADFDYIN